MKICTIVGARPQFIKAAALSRVLRAQHDEILIHTGQHYDHNMSDVFFEELAIPHPDHHLGIAGGGHGEMTGRMLMALEPILKQEKPDMTLVYGDTNSTLAGALAAVKLHIPVCHVEAGCRMGTLLNPEEVNRVLTDRISQLLLCCTPLAIENLKREGITDGVYNTGDLMYDAALYYRERLCAPATGDLLDYEGRPIDLPEEYYYLTCHRQENTATDEPLREILKAMDMLDLPTIYPVHPRNRARALRLKAQYGLDRVLLVQPVSYLTSLYLVDHAHKIVTDSGGLQREAWFYDKQCITLLDQKAWPETHAGNLNQLSRPDAAEILRKLNITPDFSKKRNQFGDGDAARKITDIISRYRL